MNRRLRFLLSAIVFMVMTAVALLGLLAGLALKFPAPDQVSLDPSQGRRPQLPQTFWRRMQRFLKTRPKERKRSQRKNQRVRNVVPGTGGPRPTVSSRDQLAFRQTVLSSFFRHNHYQRNPELIWKSVQKSKITGTWRQYEEDRLQTRILGSKFDEDKDMSILSTYREVALKTVESPFVNFEDYFWAGHASIYSRDVKSAKKYFEKAEQTWPARETFYGYIYFFGICIDAIEGDGAAVRSKFAAFQQYFPDWLYIEIYMTELTELERIYPDAPLLQFFRGEVYALVLNDAQAMSAYRRALRSDKLDRHSAGAARIRIREIAMRRKKK